MRFVLLANELRAEQYTVKEARQQKSNTAHILRLQNDGAGEDVWLAQHSAAAEGHVAVLHKLANVSSTAH